ncbi:glycoside hydrolase family 32 protein [Aerococcaceae bacterium zg-BR9]|uniref:glycoside hydrolase family 32 protein n=1 Tax=Aerococcaceae bacterium zg-1292 TaxID=2774330 RepID=UPI0040631E04|nr:glycoside hydrolase family 32 protein [Aerococcaceae bacterium zg-BR9]MBF6626248.1 glycoside hydrolase family 32 protein [Aerococcaceae bacterium zg-BR9]
MTELYTVERANNFIAQAKEQVNTHYRPKAHFVAPVGWINDPNGFVFFRGEYHLFYQYFPYDSVWGPMHWGHAKSKDLVHWEHLPVALAPDQPYDISGCFSGSAIVKDDTLWLMYTGHIMREDGTVRQVQNMAYSTDGVHFEKLASNPVLDEKDLPEVIDPADFRDPKVFEYDGKYYAVVAAKYRENGGCIVLVGSEDLVDWQFESIFLKGNAEHGIMWECPDFFQLDGEDCLVMSPMQVARDGLSHHNINTTYFMRGKVDWETKTFEPHTIEEVDNGHDFYAPQSMVDDNGRRIMIAWMHTWGRRNVTKELDHQWAMAMTIARHVQIQEGTVIQTPVLPALTTSVSLDDVIEQAIVVDVTNPEQASFELQYGSDADAIRIRYQQEENAVYINREGLKEALLGEEKIPVIERGVAVKEAVVKELRMVIDTHSIEVFINGGSAVMTSNYFFTPATEPRLQVLSGNVELSGFALS